MNCLIVLLESTRYLYILVSESMHYLSLTEVDVICTYHEDEIPPDTNELILCDSPMLGQFVKVMLAENNVRLTVTELMIFGH